MSKIKNTPEMDGAQTKDIVIYLDASFNPVPKEKATLGKVIPKDGSAPYFISPEKTAKSDITNIINTLKQHGGAGSGHHGHKGLAGQWGGSLPSGATGSTKGKTSKATGSTKGKTGKTGQAKDTMEQYRNADGTWDPERQKVHNRIVNQFFKGRTPVENPISIIMGGGPAAGKSTMLNDIDVPENHVLANADEVKALLPEYDGGAGAPFVHEESSYLSKMIAEKAAREGYNVILDGTGDSQLEKLRKKVEMLKSRGQSVHGYYVTCNIDEAVRRSMKRAVETGRIVPEVVVRMSHVGVSQVFGDAVAAGLFTEARLYDTDTKPPILVMTAKGSKMKIHDKDAWERFLKKGA